MIKEGSELVTKCNRLRLIAEDGKPRYTDVADMALMFRIIESIPSKKITRRGQNDNIGSLHRRKVLRSIW